MDKIKTLALLLCTLVFPLCFTACDDTDDDQQNGDAIPEELIGTWEVADEITVTFNEDGTGYFVDNTSSATSAKGLKALRQTRAESHYFTYTYYASLNRIVMTSLSTGGTETWTIGELTATSFVVMTAEGVWLNFDKVTNSHGDTIPTDLLGTWYSDEYGQLTFYSEGTGVYAPNESSTAQKTAKKSFLNRDLWGNFSALSRYTKANFNDAFEFTFTYHSMGPRLTVTVNSIDETWDIDELNGTTLTFTDEDGTQYTFTKNAPLITFEPDDFIGTWVYASYTLFTLNEDYSMTYYNVESGEESQETTWSYNSSTNYLDFANIRTLLVRELTDDYMIYSIPSNANLKWIVFRYTGPWTIGGIEQLENKTWHTFMEGYEMRITFNGDGTGTSDYAGYSDDYTPFTYSYDEATHQLTMTATVDGETETTIMEFGRLTDTRAVVIGTTYINDYDGVEYDSDQLEFYGE